MITCIKHKVEFINGECPSCKSLREGVSLSYSSTNPEHNSKYNLNDTIKKLKQATEKLKKLNESIEKIKILYKPKENK